MAIVLSAIPWEISVASRHVVQNDCDWPGNETVAGYPLTPSLVPSPKSVMRLWLHTNQPSDHICYDFRHHIKRSFLTSHFVRSPSLASHRVP